MTEQSSADNKEVKSGKTAYLAGFNERDFSLHEAQEHLEELKELVRTLGMEVCGEMMVNLKEPQVQYLIGSGKAQEVAEAAANAKADVIVLDSDISPSQQRNWEKLCKRKVYDRQEVILDIFAARASTKEAVLQVELARMEYMLPRLAKAWSHLSRQQGGAAGTRGEGEKQIEYDRRMVRQKIQQLNKELEEVKSRRDTQRKSRSRNSVAHAAIVGYTNAGKSSLLNALTGAGVLAEDKLFATLDPTTRKLILPDKKELLLTDTVGFVRKLPHALVEAFKSTLEEAVLADFLVLVLDAGSYQVESHWETTLAVLDELGAGDKRMLVVFNKCDTVDNLVTKARLRAISPEAVFVSAKTGEGLDMLVAELEKFAQKDSSQMNLKIGPERHDMVSLLHRVATISKSDYAEDGSFEVSALVPDVYISKFAPFVHMEKKAEKKPVRKKKKTEI